MVLNEIIAIFTGLLIMWIGVFVFFGRKIRLNDLHKKISSLEVIGKNESNISQMIQKEQQQSKYVKLQKEIKRARLNIPAEAFVFATIALSVLFTAILAVILKSPLCIAGVALGIMIPRSYLKSKQEKFQETFNTEMTKALKRMSSTLRINDSVDLALKDVVTSPLVPELVRKEFEVVYAAIQVGTPVTESFYKLYDSVPTNEVLYLCVALDIQFNSGGNKSEILDDICDQIFEKNNIKESAKSSVAEMMLTAKLMSCLPIVFLLILSTSDAGLVEFYTSTTLGQIIAIIIAGLIICGYKVIKKMAKIEI